MIFLWKGISRQDFVTHHAILLLPQQWAASQPACDLRCWLCRRKSQVPNCPFYNNINCYFHKLRSYGQRWDQQRGKPFLRYVINAYLLSVLYCIDDVSSWWHRTISAYSIPTQEDLNCCIDLIWDLQQLVLLRSHNANVSEALHNLP